MRVLLLQVEQLRHMNGGTLSSRKWAASVAARGWIVGDKNPAMGKRPNRQAGGSAPSVVTYQALSEPLGRLIATEATAASFTKWWGMLTQAQSATSTAQLDSVVKGALSAVRSAMGADAAVLVLADESGQLVTRVAVGLDPEVSEVSLAPGAGLAGRVATTRKPFLVEDLKGLSGVEPELLRSGMKAAVAVPIAGGAGLFGVLHVDSREPGHFGVRDGALLEMIGDRLAIAIGHVRLFESERSARARAEQMAERIARLQRVTAALSGDLTVEQIGELFTGELAADLGEGIITRSLWLAEEEKLVMAWSSGNEASAGAYAEMRLDAELPGPRALREAKPIFARSRSELTKQFPKSRAAARVAKAVAVLPLRIDDQKVGVLAFGYERDHDFDENERDFLSLVAQQTAQAVERARLHTAQARYMREAEFLAEVSALFGSSLDVAETLSKAAHLLVPTFADMATVYLFDDLGVLQRVAVAHRDQDAESAIAAYDDIRGYEARSAMLTVAAIAGRAMIIPSRERSSPDEISLDDEHRRMLEEMGIRSSIAVALISRGETLGLLGLMRLEDSPEFDQADLGLAEELGNRAAVSIDNALIHQRRAQVARALQASLLPPALFDIPGVEIAAAFHPAGEGAEVGGDFYDLFPLGDDRWVLMIGDVSGSGPAAAALTAQVRHGARVAGRAGLSPAAVVSAVNATLDETTGSEWFCTMVYAELAVHEDGADLQIICAGHPSPLVLRGGEVEEIETNGPLLGVIPTATFGPKAVRLGPGHALVLVTDGALEARGDPFPGADKPNFFGQEGLEKVLVCCGDSNAEEIVWAISQAVLDFSGGELSDDLAVLVLRAKPARSTG